MSGNVTAQVQSLKSRRTCHSMCLRIPRFAGTGSMRGIFARATFFIGITVLKQGLTPVVQTHSPKAAQPVITTPWHSTQTSQWTYRRALPLSKISFQSLRKCALLIRSTIIYVALRKIWGNLLNWMNLLQVLEHLITFRSVLRLANPFPVSSTL